MGIPASLLLDMSLTPRDRAVVLLMRHSARHPITDPARGFEVPLTEEGVRLAEELGGTLGSLYPGGRLGAAPVGRCIATAEAIGRGAGWDSIVQPDERISFPFIAPAWDLVFSGQLNGELPAPICNALSYLLDGSSSQPRLDVMVTHDSVIGAFAGSLLRAPVTGPDWPAFLEGILLWRDGKNVHVRWRGSEKLLPKEFATCA